MVKTFLLALLAVAAPFQAQLAYACSVMEVTVHGSCCCDGQDQTAVVSPDRVSLEKPCCETTLELIVAQDTDRSIFASARAERAPDGDLPPTIGPHSAAPLAEVPTRTAVRAAAVLVPCCVGTNTYLMTQRLRI